MKKKRGGHSPIVTMAVSIEDLRARQQALATEIQAIVDRADDDDSRDLTPDELRAVKELRAKVEALDAQIAARTPIAVSKGRQTEVDPVNPGDKGKAKPGTVAATPRTENGTYGFKSMGEFAIACRRSALGDAEINQRFLNVASTYGSEAAGSDGGFAIPPDFRAEIWAKVMGEDSLFARGEQFTTGMNALTFPKDETTPWQQSGGIQCAWESEMGTLSQSKPSLQMETIRLVKLTALVPVSDELLEDATSIESYIRIKAPIKMTSKINTAVMRGSGVGQPMGILNAGSLITVNAEVSQDVATILYANIVNMFSRMYAPSRRNAVWLINQDIEPQLLNLAFREDASSPVPAYLPAGGLSVSPYATLLGRPVIPVEACSTLGTVGDIVLVDISQYLALSKGAIRTDTSMHLYFDQAATAFRFIMRLNGQPLWGSTITPENGSMTRSWAVALATRP